MAPNQAALPQSRDADDAAASSSSLPRRASSVGGTAPRRVAVVGGGCAGLAAAWHLHANAGEEAVDVTLFEAGDRVGGHARTVSVPVEKGGEGGGGGGTTVDVDVGFMVCNDANYPNLTRWFDALGVATEESDMSLSVSLDGGDGAEWSSDGLRGLFAKRSQLLSPSFYAMLRDMLRFNREASDILKLDPDDPRRRVTTGQYLREGGYSESFAKCYLLPMMAALWSASLDDVLAFPAAQLAGFLCNHRMLQIFDRPQWKTVAGRSQSYTAAVAAALGPKRVRTSAPVASARRVTAFSVTDRLHVYELRGPGGDVLGTYDDVVFACHPPTAARILAEGNAADPALLALLRGVEYADNALYLHSDPALMPRRKDAWASWNCLGKSEELRTASLLRPDRAGEAMEGGATGFQRAAAGGARASNAAVVVGEGGATDETGTVALEGEDGRMRAVYVTYWLNRLQNLKCEDDVFVSLNPHRKPDPGLTHEKFVMGHPQFTPRTLEARAELQARHQGRDGLWFVGAWSGYGFHEDACRSGFQVAAALSGVPLPWASSAAPVLAPPELWRREEQVGVLGAAARILSSARRLLARDLPVAICRRFILSFLRAAVTRGTLRLKLGDGSVATFGDGTKCGHHCDARPVTLRVFDDWFFVKAALEYDLGLARSYMAGHFVVEPLEDVAGYDPVLRPPAAREEANAILGDPVGLTRLFLLFIGNRDNPALNALPMKSARGHTVANALTNASGLLISKIGSFCNFVRYKLLMDNSERGGSLKNIHAHYDLSNDLFTSFLDKETLMYSSAIYDAVAAPAGYSAGVVLRGTLEQAQWRKLDTLLNRAQVRPGQTVLDIGFGWGGLSLHAARKYGCRVTGITLSVEQMALATERVEKEGLGHLITFEVCDYRSFARRPENRGAFDRVLSCEMIEAVGHEHLGEFFWAVEQVLAYDGILVMEAITTPEARYETYRRSTDLINTIIFPGSCCPSLHALVDAAYRQSRLTLEHIDNIGLHYAQTLAEWRRRFNANEALVRRLGFDDVFMRVWNYYLTYCEAGFFSQTENCLILVFSRPGCPSLVPLCETRSVTQLPALTDDEVKNWLEER